MNTRWRSNSEQKKLFITNFTFHLDVTEHKNNVTKQYNWWNVCLMEIFLWSRSSITVLAMPHVAIFSLLVRNILDVTTIIFPRFYFIIDHPEV